MNAMFIVLAADVDAELHRVPARDPRDVVGDLPDVVDAADERLLRVAEREERR